MRLFREAWSWPLVASIAITVLAAIIIGVRVVAQH